jgi:riboflavin biosynthesis pyrimidine reductase
MATLEPLETLFDTERGETLSMPPELAMIYGKLQFPPRPDRAHVIGNFVETLDGVVSLNTPGQSGGAEISGNSQQDRIVMGILRAAADAVVVGAGTLRSVPQHIWSSDYIFPALADSYRAFRGLLGKSGAPLNVIVTGRGEVDLALPVFASGRVATLIVTRPQGAERLGRERSPKSVRVEAVAGADRIRAGDVLAAIQRVQPVKLVLVEGGPHLIGDFMGEGLLDELFLTLAPQIAGRANEDKRPALVEGRIFAPERPLWSDLVSVKRADNHLFLRYAFRTGQ